MVTKTGVGVTVVEGEVVVALMLVELEIEVEVGVEDGVGDDGALLIFVPDSAGTVTGSMTVVVTFAVTVGPGLVTSTVFVVWSTTVVASAGASVEVPPPTLTTL